MKTIPAARLGLLVAAAVTGAVALSSSTAYAADTEKCYGVAKAGKNDCAGPAHACAGQSKMDAGGKEWIYVPKGTCERLSGGSATAK